MENWQENSQVGKVSDLDKTCSLLEIHLYSINLSVVVLFFNVLYGNTIMFHGQHDQHCQHGCSCMLVIYPVYCHDESAGGTCVISLCTHNNITLFLTSKFWMYLIHGQLFQKKQVRLFQWDMMIEFSNRTERWDMGADYHVISFIIHVAHVYVIDISNSQDKLHLIVFISAQKEDIQQTLNSCFLYFYSRYWQGKVTKNVNHL